MWAELTLVLKESTDIILSTVGTKSSHIYSMITTMNQTLPLSQGYCLLIDEMRAVSAVFAG